MDEPKQQLSCGSVGWDRLPPLSSRHVWLVSQNLEAGEQIFYNIDDPTSFDHYHRCRIPELLGRRIRATFHGWLILSSYPRAVMWSLWDPLTSTLIRLPPLSHQHGDSHECCLSAPPVDDPTSSAVFLLTTNDKPSNVFCRLDRKKRKRLKWTEMSYANQVKSITYDVDKGCVLESPTCCNGKVYALTRGAYILLIMQIDIVVKKDKQVVITLLPFLEAPTPCFNHWPPFNRGSSFLPSLKGTCMELFYTVVDFNAETSTVFNVSLSKLDMTSSSVTTTWEELKDLKDAVFFVELVSDYSVFFRRGVAPELGGYVHILGEMGKVIYSYHIKDTTISPSSMPCVVRESQAWAMLEFRLEGDDADSKQREEDRDNDIDVRRLISRDDDEIVVSNNSTTTGECESPLLDIPFHLLEKIMEHCVGVEYMNFRTTCKHCHLAAPPIQWRSNKTTTLQMYSLVSPWLMVLDYKDRGVITFIDPMGGDRYFVRKTSRESSIAGHHIYYSRYGWLLMYKLGSGSLVLFNPLTNVICKLPRIFRIDMFCFSAPPTCPDCTVVGFTTCDEWHVYIHSVGREQSWRRFTLNFGGGDDPYSFRFPTFYGRDLYAVSYEGGVGVFRQTGDGDYSLERLVSKAPTTCSAQIQYFLAANCDDGRILLVILREFGESVEVFNLNHSKLEWEKIDGLGKHMIYISDTTCLCIKAKLPEMESKIYFSRLSHPGGNGGKLVFYSLETCRFHTFDGKNIQQGFDDLFGTIYHCYSHTWIEPSWLL